MHNTDLTQHDVSSQHRHRQLKTWERTFATLPGCRPPASIQPRLPRCCGGCRRAQSMATPLPPCMLSISTHSTSLQAPMLLSEMRV